MIQVRTFCTPCEIGEEDLRGCSAVVIDILRSSSTIVHALLNGAREVIPVSTPGQAAEIAARTGRDSTLLAGERDGKLIEGFDLSNSPLEFTGHRVYGRSIAFASTNGAPLIVKAKSADQVYIGGFNNYTWILKQLLTDARPVALLCAGKQEHFCIEDFVCAGMIAEGIECALDGQVQLSDSSRAARWLYSMHASAISALLRSCSHGQYLASIGFNSDLEVCAKVNSHPIVPTLIEGKIKGTRLHASQSEHIYIVS